MKNIYFIPIPNYLRIVVIDDDKQILCDHPMTKDQMDDLARRLDVARSQTTWDGNDNVIPFPASNDG